MIAVKKRAEYIPALNSYFITEYTEAVAEAIKLTRLRSLGGDKYLGRARGAWEVSEEVWNLIKHFPHTFYDKSVNKPEPVVLRVGETEAEKYVYQDKAAEMLRGKENCLLFFDTGTGKTRTALLALSKLAKGLDAVIVVGQLDLSKSWMAQVKEHFAAMLPRFMILSDKQSVAARIRAVNEADEGTVFVVNIESMRNKSFVSALNQRDLAVTVLDECQCIIGSNSQQTLGMHDLESPFRWALSATPIKNSPLEWYSLLSWLRVIPFEGAKTRFKQYYAYETRDRWGRIQYNTFRNQDDLEDLKNLVAIRVEKEGLRLPPRNIVPVPLTMSSELKALIKRIDSEKSKDEIDTEFQVAGYTLEAGTCSDLFYIERVATAMDEEKIAFVLNHVDEPTVVVSCFKLPLDYIYSLIPDKAALYHGGVGKEERERALQDFISGKKSVLLMTRKTGGTGLDGLQKKSRRLIMLDAPENMANFNQCADRVHRIHQIKEVFVYLLKTSGSLDLYAWDNIDKKQGWIDRYYKVNYEEDR